MAIKIKNVFNPLTIKNKIIFTEIDFNFSTLNEDEKKIIHYLVECANIIQDIFYIQKYKNNLLLKEEIKKIDIPYLNEYFEIMSGPFDVYNDNEPYIEEINGERIYFNPRANFYPSDLTIDEWNETLQKKPELKKDFLSPYTVIVRENNELKPVKYSEYYKDYLEKANHILLKAGEYAKNFSLQSYLQAQANGFLNNDFYEADIRWLQLEDNLIEPLIGAHEFYEDKFLGYKAAFTSFIGLRRDNENKRVQFIEKIFDKLQSLLPIPEFYKKTKRGSQSKIQVIDLIYSTGDAKGAFQTIAFNLPNSQKIKTEFGSKKVLLYNIIKEKFEKILIPISKKLLTEKEILRLTFAANFNIILFHEISHELGIYFVKDSNGSMNEVSYYLKDLYSIIEETKADIMGIYFLFYLIKECFISDCSFIEVGTTYLMHLFRTIRFGKESAHCISSIIQWNFLRKEGIFINVGENKFSIDLHKFEKVIENFLSIILNLQMEGNYEKTKNFIDRYSIIDDELNSVINSLKDIPIDIYPIFKLKGF